MDNPNISLNDTGKEYTATMITPEAMLKAATAIFNDVTSELVRDRKTGEMYNPKEAFNEMMNTPEIMDVMKRLKVR